MANPNPVKKSDYRLVGDPKLMTRDMLVDLAKRYPDSEFTAKMAADDLGIGHPQAACRLQRLKTWGCVRIAKRGRGKEPYYWQITAWGKSCARRWGQVSPDKGQPVP